MLLILICTIKFDKNLLIPQIFSHGFVHPVHTNDRTLVCQVQTQKTKRDQVQIRYEQLLQYSGQVMLCYVVL